MSNDLENETKDRNSEEQVRYVTRRILIRSRKSVIPKKKKITISISVDTRDRIERLNKTHASYDVVLNEILDIIEKEMEKGENKNE